MAATGATARTATMEALINNEDLLLTHDIYHWFINPGQSKSLRLPQIK